MNDGSLHSILILSCRLAVFPLFFVSFVHCPSDFSSPGYGFSLMCHDEMKMRDD